MPAAGDDPVWRCDPSVAQVAVIVALKIEARTLDALPRPQRDGVRVSGPGPERAARAARDAIAGGAGALVSWGFAGGLRDGLDCGAVMLPARILDPDGEWPTDAAWRRRLAGVFGRRFALSDEPIWSAPAVVDSPQAKRALQLQTGAAAVDMESAAIARAARHAGLPFMAIRVVADGAGDALPAGVENLVAADGGTRYRGLWSVLASPTQLRLLRRLASRSQAARRVLRELSLALTERQA